MSADLHHEVGLIAPMVTKSMCDKYRLRADEGCVYRFLNADGGCIYIGYTAEPLNRWQAHRRKPWFEEVAAIYYETGLPAREALAIEREAIRDERPKYNRTVSK